MNILLINENYHFVLKEDCPPVPPANASKNVLDKYDCWVVANNKARCYLLAAMNEVFRAKHEALDQALLARLWNLCKTYLDAPLIKLVTKL